MTGDSSEVEAWFLAGPTEREAPPSRSRKFRPYLLGTLCLGILSLTSLRDMPETAISAHRGVKLDELTITVATPPVVGENLVFVVDGASEGQVIEVAVDGGYGPRRVAAVSTGDATELTVPPANYPESGMLLVTVAAGRSVGQLSVNMQPGPSADPIDVYLGPRTVSADGLQYTMAVAVPKDQFGNPTSDGTPLSYGITRADGATEQHAHHTTGLISWIEIDAGTVAGRTRVSSAAEGSGAVEQTFLEIAGVPQPFGLSVLGAIPVADGRSLFTVRTDRLLDQFGNELPDGTAVYLDISGVLGIGRTRSVSLDGAAEFTIEAPTRPGRVLLVATASGIAGLPLVVDVATAVEDIPVSVSRHPDGWRIEIGQVYTTLGSYVPDATIAKLTLGDRFYEAVFENGVAVAVVPEPSAGPYQLTVLGRQVAFVGAEP